MKFDYAGPQFIVAFAPAGGLVAVGNIVAGIQVYDVAAGRFVRTLPGGRVFAFSPDGKVIAAGNREDHAIRLWDVTTGRERAVLRGHEGIVTALHFSPDGRLLLSGSTDHTILLWEMKK
jgi:WD40 repeat protein